MVLAVGASVAVADDDPTPLLDERPDGSAQGLPVVVGCP